MSVHAISLSNRSGQRKPKVCGFYCWKFHDFVVIFQTNVTGVTQHSEDLIFWNMQVEILSSLGHLPLSTLVITASSNECSS